MRYSKRAIEILTRLVDTCEEVHAMGPRDKTMLGRLLDNLYEHINETDRTDIPESLRDAALNSVDLLQGLRLTLDPHYDFEHFHLHH